MHKTKEQTGINEEASTTIEACRQWLGEIAQRFENHHSELGGAYFLEFLSSTAGSVLVKRMVSTHSHEPVYVLAYDGEVPEVGAEKGSVTAILMPPTERQQPVWAGRAELDATFGTFIIECLQQEHLRPVGYMATGDPDQPVRVLDYPVLADATS